MKSITVKNCIFGDWNPKICVPIVGRTKDEILNHAIRIKLEAERLEAMEEYAGRRVDVIEFRADFYDDVTSRKHLTELLGNLREVFPERLILFTYRSEAEGGEIRNDHAECRLDDIIECAVDSGNIDLLDIELFSGNYQVAKRSAKAHENGVKVILSYHNFKETPTDEFLIKVLTDMEGLGGDLLKFAVTPNCKEDVERILNLTKAVTKGESEANEIESPVIVISMKELGRISRISGRETGSAMTFSAVGQESAPGQVGLEEMFQVL